MPRTVTQIQFPTPIPKARRVAAYARVSSDKDTMLHSLAAQVDYYSTYIRHHPGWAYVGVYADEAKTGTRDSRENFQRMLADCRAGKIDHIITKSVSRFSRNTVTLLETIRELVRLTGKYAADCRNMEELAQIQEELDSLHEKLTIIQKLANSRLDALKQLKTL